MPRLSTTSIVVSVGFLLATACVPLPTNPLPRRTPVPQPPPRQTPEPPEAPSPAPQQGSEITDVYKNIKVLHGPANRMDAVMKEFNSALGVGCTYCHVNNEWSADVAMKEKARMMVDLSNHVNEKLPKGEVTCWTCHRGEAVPDRLSALAPESPEVARAIRLVGLTDAQAQQPVEKVFKNLKVFGGFPAGNLPFAMAYYTKTLGVDCKFCHVEQFATDTPHKDSARGMITMVETSGTDFYKGEKNPIRCWTCHRGNHVPEAAPLSSH